MEHLACTQNNCIQLAAEERSMMQQMGTEESTDVEAAGN